MKKLVTGKNFMISLIFLLAYKALDDMDSWYIHRLRYGIDMDSWYGHGLMVQTWTQGINKGSQYWQHPLYLLRLMIKYWFSYVREGQVLPVCEIFLGISAIIRTLEEVEWSPICRLFKETLCAVQFDIIFVSSLNFCLHRN